MHTVCLKNRTGNSQPHPHAGAAGRKERFKQSRKIVLADTGPGVLHSHDNIAFRVNSGLDYEFALAVADQLNAAIERLAIRLGA